MGQYRECEKPFQPPPLNTSAFYKTYNLPKRFECPYMFQGYGIQKEDQNIYYKTTSNDYGWYTPSPHTVPIRYFPKSCKFTKHLAPFGMYRNFSLNTGTDKTYI